MAVILVDERVTYPSALQFLSRALARSAGALRLVVRQLRHRVPPSGPGPPLTGALIPVPAPVQPLSAKVGRPGGLAQGRKHVGPGSSDVMGRARLSGTDLCGEARVTGEHLDAGSVAMVLARVPQVNPPPRLLGVQGAGTRGPSKHTNSSPTSWRRWRVSTRSGQWSAMTSMASCRYRQAMARDTSQSRARPLGPSPWMNQRSTKTVWVQHPAARCHGLAATCLRWVANRPLMARAVDPGTSRVARRDSSRGSWGSTRDPGRNRSCPHRSACARLRHTPIHGTPTNTPPVSIAPMRKPR